MSLPIPDLPKVELRLLRYVIAVAEELHFTRASIRLHLATPSLSRQIRQLEETLGYALFERKTRSVALTRAGTAFVVEARRALAYAQRAVEAGAVANTTTTEVIRIGYTPLLDATLLRQIRDVLTREVDSINVQFQSSYSSVQIDQVSTGHLDAGLVVLPIEQGDLQITELFSDPLIAAIPEGSALATAPMPSIEDFAKQPIVWFSNCTNPHLHRHFVTMCQEAGFTPHITQEVSTVIEMLDLVSAGIGIGFVKSSLPRRLHPEGIAFRSIDPLSLSLDIGIAYSGDSLTDGLRSLLAILLHISHSDRDR
jgi:DNA-binding transcriptional LysR family regulator